MVVLAAPRERFTTLGAPELRAVTDRVASALRPACDDDLETGWGQIPPKTASGALPALVAAALERGRRERAMRMSLAIVSHEMRTPLTTIAAYLDDLRDQLDDDRSLHAFTVLEHEVGRLIGFVESLLESATMDLPGAIVDEEPSGLDVVLHAACDAVAPWARDRRVEISIDADDDARVAVAPQHAQRIFVNLLHNAIRHGAQSGHIAVSVERRVHDAVVFIDDDGAGVAPEDRERIFEPHMRGRTSARDGWGLGLTVVRSIVERAHGEIAVDRSPFGGARFAVTLPLAV